MKNVGFIGCGNMAGAMIEGIIDSGVCDAAHIMASNRSAGKLEARKEKNGILTTLNNVEVAKFADILFLAVKPQFYETVIEEIKDVLTTEQIIISIAPGKTFAWFAERMGSDKKYVRCMPNTPAMVKEGMIGMCVNENVTEEETAEVVELCKGFSRTEVIPESLMDVVTCVSGSSPAYVFLFIEALADAAVAGGMPRKQAYNFAAQAVFGSAKMVLETGMHPGELKDMVCSPGGTTIQAVRVLEERGLRSAVFEAATTCLEKSRQM